jgi:hypothetical protein
MIDTAENPPSCLSPSWVCLGPCHVVAHLLPDLNCRIQQLPSNNLLFVYREFRLVIQRHGYKDLCGNRIWGDRKSLLLLFFLTFWLSGFLSRTCRSAVCSATRSAVCRLWGASLIVVTLMGIRAGFLRFRLFPLHPL